MKSVQKWVDRVKPGHALATPAYFSGMGKSADRMWQVRHAFGMLALPYAKRLFLPFDAIFNSSSAQKMSMGTRCLRAMLNLIWHVFV